MLTFPKKHPYVWAGICFVVGIFPQWLSSVWALFCTDPLVVVLRRQDWWPPMTFSPWFVSVPLAVLLFLLARLTDKTAAPTASPLTEQGDGPPPTSVIVVRQPVSVPAQTWKAQLAARLTQTLPNTELSLQWQQVDTNHLHFQVLNLRPEKIEGLQVILTDLRHRMPADAEFAEHQDSGYRQGAFVRLALRVPTPLFRGEPQIVPFLILDTWNLMYGGIRLPEGYSDTRTIRATGIWQIKVRIEHGQRFREETLCFAWLQKERGPVPFQC